MYYHTHEKLHIWGFIASGFKSGGPLGLLGHVISKKPRLIKVNIQFNISPFLFTTFSTLNFFWFFLATLVHKNFQQFLFRFNHKNFFRPIWNVTFCKIIFVFQFSYMVTNFKVLINFLAAPDSFFIMYWIFFYIIILQPWFQWDIVKFAAFFCLYFVWFSIRLT